MGRHSGYKMSEETKRKISQSTKERHEQWPVIAEGNYPFRVETKGETYLFLVQAEHPQQAGFLLDAVLAQLIRRGYSLNHPKILRVTTFSRAYSEPTIVLNSGLCFPSAHLMKAKR